MSFLLNNSSSVNELNEKEKEEDYAFMKDLLGIGKSILRYTSKALWIVGSSAVLIGIPLLLEVHRDQQYTEMEIRQSNFLTAQGYSPAQINQLKESVVNPNRSL